VLTGVNGMAEVDFSLVNSKGQIVVRKKMKSFAGETTDLISFPKLPTGMYFARFASGDKIITRKVVVNQ